MLTTVLGEPALFDFVDDAEIPALSIRERRLLVGAVNFHTAVVPGRVLRFHVYGGDDELTPRTTDDRTFDGLSRIFRRRLYSFTARGHATPSRGVADPVFTALTERSDRHLHISPDSVLDVDPRRWIPNNILRKMAREIRNRAPIVYDELRDVELMRHRAHERRTVKRRDYASEFGPRGRLARRTVVVPPPSKPTARRAVLIGVHWFELGGAERWAFESVRIVREAGLLPIVISNVDSQHPFLARPELEGSLIIPMSEPTFRSQPEGQEPLLATLLSLFDVRAVLVHHNQWLYDRLPWISLARPDVEIIDSTHIVEHRGGGYPVSATLADSYISRHHVISPTLAGWMRDVQKVDPQKIVMAPLAGLTVDSAEPAFRERSQGEPFTVAFVGRMARQKAPEVFVEAARLIHAKMPDVRFIVHGEGEHASWVTDLIRRGDLEAAVVRRTSADPVSATLDESHLLVITSANEGLTLTTFEAINHGIPAVSTDVGAQRDIIPESGLVSPSPARAVREMADLVMHLAVDETARKNLWAVERANERRLAEHESATQWMERTARAW